MGWIHLVIFGVGVGVGLGSYSLLDRVNHRSQAQRHRPVDRLSPPPPTTTIAKPITQPITQPIAEPIAQPITQPIAQPIAELTEPEPVAETPQIPTSSLSTQLAYHIALEQAQFAAGFLARTSHELRSPINSIISLHQLILSDLADSPEEEREFLIQAATAAEKMLAVLDRLISVSKTVYGSETLQLQPVSLQEILNNVHHLTELQAKNRNLDLSIALPEPDVLVLTDRRWLTYILTNLIDVPLALMQTGTVHLSVHLSSVHLSSIHLSMETIATHDQERVNQDQAKTTDHVKITIVDERPATVWAEAIDWIDRLKVAQPLTDLGELHQQLMPSPGLALLVNQTLMERLGGQLILVSLPNAVEQTTLTQVDCLIPIAIAKSN